MKSKIIDQGRVTRRQGKSHHGSIRKFIAVDGEGETINGRHEYVLIGIGNDQLSNPKGLHWTAIFEFLYSHFEESASYVGFFLGYDFTQWFKTLPISRAEKLLTREGIASRKHSNPNVPFPHPVQARNWQFDILGSKRFRFRPKVCDCDNATCKCPGQNPWMYICDSGPFFQKAFLSVIKPSDWPEGTITNQEYEDIKFGKENRSSAHLGPDMLRYNRLENEILQRIMYLLDDAFKKIGINLKKTQWFGPGQAAQEWMKGRAPSREEIEEYVPAEFREFARESYFGGWFEIFCHGLIPGISYEYDINSAYPYIIANMPCLLHGTYKFGTGKPEIDIQQKEIALVRACVSGDTNNSRYTGTLPHRNKKGGICRPTKVIGTYWYHEIEAAKNARAVGNIEYLEYFKYTPCKCPPPMAEIANLYKLRLEVGKNTPFGLACKLVYNSMYGKFAQSVGFPRFGNAVYASYITSGCRTMILNAIASHPNGWKDVLMVATDGVYFKNPHPTLPLSDNELGKWDCTEKENLTLFKPGVFWDDKARNQIEKGELPVFKARGVSARDFAEVIFEIDDHFARLNGPYITIEDWPSITYKPQFHMTTALQALIQHDWSLAGKVSDDKEMVQNSCPFEKRSGIAYYDPEYELYRTIPRSVETILSVPYKKQFGDNSVDALSIPFTNEWQQRYGITPDEHIGEIFSSVITGKESE